MLVFNDPDIAINATRGNIMLHDNAHAHMACTVQNTLRFMCPQETSAER